MPRTRSDWARVAQCHVKITSDAMFEQHRGVASCDYPGITVVFGNDGLVDNQRAIDGLADVRAYLAANGIKELGFATAHDGYSWAMLVRSKDKKTLSDILWDAKTYRLREERGEVPLTMAAPPIEETLAALTKYIEGMGSP
jgi:hypothetical protein